MPILGALVGFFALSGAIAALPATAVALAPAPVPVAHTIALPMNLPTYAVTMTGYNAVPAQTDNNPTITASGAFANPQVVAARSQDLGKELPFGTIIEVEGPSKTPGGGCGYGIVQNDIGYRVIADTMNRKFTDRVDVLFATKDNYLLMGNGHVLNAATIMGVCPAMRIRVVGFVNISNPANLPTSQAALAALVRGRTASN